MTRLMAIVLVLMTFQTAAQQAGAAVAAGSPSVNLALPLGKTKADQLYLLGRVWGFLKYHHPAITKGKYDWDKQLVGLMPAYLGTKDKQQACDTLLAWINGLGDVPACDSGCDDRALKAALAPDTAWIRKAGMSKGLSNKIVAIRVNRTRGNQHYVRFMSEDDIHVALFEHENSYASMTYPPVEYRLLALFRYWNMIEYWYPYKYELPVKWEKVLETFIPRVVAAADAGEYVAAMQALIASIHDSHAVVQSRVISENLGNYVMPCWIKFIEGKAIVIDILNDSLAQRSNVQRGDIIESINGVTVARLVKDKRPFISASNEASYLNLLRYSLVRSRQETNEWVISRGGQSEKRPVQYALSKTTRKIKPGTFAMERDSTICLVGDGIGYINLGNFQRKDSISLRKLVSSVKGLVIDNRQYPKGLSAGDIIGHNILREVPAFVKFSSADPAMPGRFQYSRPTNMGATGN